MEVIVKLKPEIAKACAGFCDIEAGQDIYPPRKKGKPEINHEFQLKATSFVERKIANGELILVKRLPAELPVLVGDKEISVIDVEGLSAEQIESAVLEDKKVAKAVGDKGIKLSIETDRVQIEVK